jgi:hypothetical protein
VFREVVNGAKTYRPQLRIAGPLWYLCENVILYPSAYMWAPYNTKKSRLCSVLLLAVLLALEAVFPQAVSALTLPRLTLSIFTVNAPQAGSGPITVSLEVMNSDSAALGDLEFSVLLSQVDPASGDVRLYDKMSSDPFSLAAGERKAFSFPYDLPPSVVSGDYTLTIRLENGRGLVFATSSRAVSVTTGTNALRAEKPNLVGRGTEDPAPLSGPSDAVRAIWVPRPDSQDSAANAACGDLPVTVISAGSADATHPDQAPVLTVTVADGNGREIGSASSAVPVGESQTTLRVPIQGCVHTPQITASLVRGGLVLDSYSVTVPLSDEGQQQSVGEKVGRAVISVIVAAIVVLLVVAVLRIYGCRPGCGWN